MPSSRPRVRATRLPERFRTRSAASRIRFAVNRYLAKAPKRFGAFSISLPIGARVPRHFGKEDDWQTWNVVALAVEQEQTRSRVEPNTGCDRRCRGCCSLFWPRGVGTDRSRNSFELRSFSTH